jgi:hypothetical protein
VRGRRANVYSRPDRIAAAGQTTAA